MMEYSIVILIEDQKAQENRDVKFSLQDLNIHHLTMFLHLVSHYCPDEGHSGIFVAQ